MLPTSLSGNETPEENAFSSVRNQPSISAAEFGIFADAEWPLASASTDEQSDFESILSDVVAGILSA